MALKISTRPRGATGSRGPTRGGAAQGRLDGGNGSPFKKAARSSADIKCHPGWLATAWKRSAWLSRVA
eukprot:13529240-Alexandrium_andersonii.AAC.1